MGVMHTAEAPPSVSTYTNKKCRCAECREIWSQYMKESTAPRIYRLTRQLCVDYAKEMGEYDRIRAEAVRQVRARG